jgi:hypothetical protein
MDGLDAGGVELWKSMLVGGLRWWWLLSITVDCSVEPKSEEEGTVAWLLVVASGGDDRC